MTKGLRAAGLVALSLCAAGFATVWRPQQRGTVGDAAVIGAFYAAPAEEVETHVLGRGETLSGILSRSSISGIEQSDLLVEMARFINPRRLVANTEVTVHRLTEDGTTRSVDIRINKDSTVRMEHEAVAGWISKVVVTPTKTDTVFIDGTIEEGRSVFESIATDDRLNAPVQDRYAVADALADIYQYKLNFAQDIKPGDRFRILYEREVRPDGSARHQRILASEIRNEGTTFAAFYFDPYKDGGEYYDADGKSLKYAFSRYPMSPRLITSGYGKRFHPILGYSRQHAGTDFGAAYGTPIKATGDGVIASAGRSGGYGNVVVIRHPGGYTTRYAHMSRFAAGIRSGKRVEQGTLIGYVGTSGLSTGPHLHYELRKNGVPINARTAKLPGAPPLPSEYRGTFRRIVGTRTALMERAEESQGSRLAANGEKEPRWREGT